MDRDIRLALLGDHEAAKRLTDAGVLVPCPFCKNDNQHTLEVCREEFDYYILCGACGAEGPYSIPEEKAILDWNTRAPILSAEELKKLEETT